MAYDSRDILKAEGIHTAVDTTGFAKWEVVEAVLPYTDLFLYDIKHMDSVRHRELTGVGNELILKNLSWLAENEAIKPKLLIRLPLLTGLNDDPQEIRNLGGFLQALDLHQATLLPYHSLGLGKARGIGLAQEQFAAPDESRLAAIRQELAVWGVTAKLRD